MSSGQFCVKIIFVAGYIRAGRRVGMADEADSKSVVGNHVRVQVPLPAGNGAKSNHVGSGFAPFCVGKPEGKMNLLASVSVYVGERR